MEVTSGEMRYICMFVHYFRLRNINSSFSSFYFFVFVNEMHSKILEHFISRVYF